MKPADIIEVPINVIVDMLLSGDIGVDELTDEQKRELPASVRKELGI
jgi:hypothetical protein